MAKTVGVFCPTLHNYGGGEFVSVAIANTLAQNGYDVTLFTTKPVDAKSVKNFFGETLHPKISAVTQPTSLNIKGLMGFYQNVFRSYIAKTKTTVFIDPYSNCVFPWTNVCYIHFPTLNRTAYRTRFPYLQSIHHTEVGALPQVIMEKNLATYDDKLVLANSHYTAHEIEAFSGKKAHVLYPPYTSSIKNFVAQTKQDLVVTTSRFEQNKKLEKIPKIAAKTSSHVQFAVIGRLYDKAILGHLQAQVKKLGLTERVKFYPDLPAKQKLQMLATAKVYLHTMVGEHFGISIVEAMASGCIPVSHNSGGMVEFVPAENRYETVEQAAGIINSAIGGWSEDKTVEPKQIAEQFSINNFSCRFMELFSKYEAF
ncbi:MAG: glycosyltransferase [Candidatus Bathyarchaeia archaeon]|jgi:glycosyltransferase involved in cell wall biosynthesis